jgi:hypothetical protein
MNFHLKVLTDSLIALANSNKFNHHSKDRNMHVQSSCITIKSTAITTYFELPEEAFDILFIIIIYNIYPFLSNTIIFNL